MVVGCCWAALGSANCGVSFPFCYLLLYLLMGGLSWYQRRDCSMKSDRVEFALSISQSVHCIGRGFVEKCECLQQYSKTNNE